MARYTDDSKERVRDAVDMVDLVGTRVELRRAGATRYEGLCPFNDERTPSFGINPAEKRFDCFGCGERGDAFKFVQLTEGVEFEGALEFLADRYGVQLEVVEDDPATAERGRARDRLLELLEHTAAWYARALWEAKEADPARAYLASRGLEEGLLREFRVGYAPSAWDRLLLASRRAGFSDRELVAAGLASRARDGDARTTASADGSCSRSATRAGACSASARGRWGKGSSRGTCTPPTTRFTTAAGTSSGPTSRARTPRAPAA